MAQDNVYLIFYEDLQGNVATLRVVHRGKAYAEAWFADRFPSCKLKKIHDIGSQVYNPAAEDLGLVE